MKREKKLTKQCCLNFLPTAAYVSQTASSGPLGYDLVLYAVAVSENCLCYLISKAFAISF